MPNPKPTITDGFKAQQQPKYGDKALGKTIGVRFSEEVDELLRSKIADRQAYIREAVEQKLKADGLL